MKKLLTTLLAIAMILAMCIPVMADSTTGSNTGKITITNATKGATYKAYKIFDATANGDAVAYTTDATGKAFINESSNSLFTVSETPNSEGRYAVQLADSSTPAATIVTWLSANYSHFENSGKEGDFDASDSTYTISDLDYGYYYVKSSLGAVISIDTVTGTVKEIKDKNTQGPNTPDKNIIAEDGQSITSTDSNDCLLYTSRCV